MPDGSDTKDFEPRYSATGNKKRTATCWAYELHLVDGSTVWVTIPEDD